MLGRLESLGWSSYFKVSCLATLIPHHVTQHIHRYWQRNRCGGVVYSACHNTSSAGLVCAPNPLKQLFENTHTQMKSNEL